MNDKTNEVMVTMTIRVPPELVRTLRLVGKRLGMNYTTVARRCLLALVSPSEIGDLVMSSVGAAGQLPVITD